MLGSAGVEFCLLQTSLSLHLLSIAHKVAPRRNSQNSKSSQFNHFATALSNPTASASSTPSYFPAIKSAYFLIPPSTSFFFLATTSRTNVCAAATQPPHFVLHRSEPEKKNFFSCCALTPSEVLRGEKENAHSFPKAQAPGTRTPQKIRAFAPLRSAKSQRGISLYFPNNKMYFSVKFRFSSPPPSLLLCEAVFLFPLRWPSGPDCRRQRSASPSSRTDTHF